MRLTVRRDLTMDFTPEGRIRYRSVGTGVEGVGPVDAVHILSFCTQPRTRQEVAARFGEGGGHAFDALQQGGLLVPPEQAEDTPLFFDSFTSLDIHRRMLSDRCRVEAYAAALTQQITPDSVVLDAGTGTGILACMAAHLGARHVYAVDRSSLSLATQVVAASGFSTRISLIQADLRTVVLPEKVDVVVSETFGAMALAEGGMEDVFRCCAQNLKPGGRVIPQRVSLWMAPIVSTEELPDNPGVFGLTHGADLRPLRQAAFQRGVVTPIPGTALGGAGQCVLEAAYPWSSSTHTASVVFPTVQGASLLGWAAWFDLLMAPDQVLSTAPDAPLTHWKQQFLPVDGWSLAAGEPLQVEIGLRPAMGDRRGLEVASRWQQGGRSGSQIHRVV